VREDRVCDAKEPLVKVVAPMLDELARWADAPKILQG